MCFFARRFVELAKEAGFGNRDGEEMTQMLTRSLDTASREILRPAPARPKKPWISIRTLELITKRNEARQRGENQEESELNKRIRRSVKKDRSDWLDKMLSDGS